MRTFLTSTAASSKADGAEIVTMCAKGDVPGYCQLLLCDTKTPFLTGGRSIVSLEDGERVSEVTMKAACRTYLVRFY